MFSSFFLAASRAPGAGGLVHGVDELRCGWLRRHRFSKAALPMTKFGSPCLGRQWEQKETEQKAGRVLM